MTPAAATAARKRRRFSHEEAFAYYASLGETRTLALVAKQFGVSDTAIGKVARADNWAERAAALERRASTQTEERLVKSFADRQRDQLLTTQKLRARIMDSPDSAIDVNTAVRALPRYATVERLIAGEATSRVAIADLQPTLEAYGAQLLELAALARQVDPEAVDRCLDRLDDQLALLAAAAVVSEDTVAA